MLFVLRECRPVPDDTFLDWIFVILELTFMSLATATILALPTLGGR